MTCAKPVIRFVSRITDIFSFLLLHVLPVSRRRTRKVVCIPRIAFLPRVAALKSNLPLRMAQQLRLSNHAAIQRTNSIAVLAFVFASVACGRTA